MLAICLLAVRALIRDMLESVSLSLLDTCRADGLCKVSHGSSAWTQSVTSILDERTEFRAHFGCLQFQDLMAANTRLAAEKESERAENKRLTALLHVRMPSIEPVKACLVLT